MLKKYAVIGVGKAGCTSISKLKTSEIYDRIAVDTDETNIKKAIADRKILVKKSLTNGLGCCGDLTLGILAFLTHKNEFVQIIDNYKNVIFVCGLGGGMSGFIGAISHILEKNYIFILTKPFSFEGKCRGEKAQKVLDELADCNKILIEQDLIKFEGGMSLMEVFDKIDKIILNHIVKITQSN